MNILLTGGGGAVGSYLTKHFLEQGHYVKVIDLNPIHLDFASSKFEIIKATTTQRDVVKDSLQGIDAIIHCAWSFSDLAEDVFTKDLVGLIYLLEETAKMKPKLFCNMSSAIVYGSPKNRTIEEEHPCLAEEARKPVYALGKLTAEKLCAVYAKDNNYSAVSIRFWWGFAEEIGGKHLRAMIKTALDGHDLEVPAEAGGSFLHFADLAHFLDLLLQTGTFINDIFNLASLYITWEEIALMIKDVVNKGIEVIPVPREMWAGSSFLTDWWELDVAKAKENFGFKERFSSNEIKSLLKEAIIRCMEKM